MRDSELFDTSVKLLYTLEQLGLLNILGYTNECKAVREAYEEMKELIKKRKEEL